MEDSNEKILWDGYGLRFYGGIRTRTGLICKTDQGLCELKKARNRKETILFAHDVKEHLYQNGFVKINRFYPTLDAQPLYQKDGFLYLLEAPLPPNSLPEDSLDCFIKGASTLGQLHKSAEHFSSPYEHWDLEKLPQQFAKRQAELSKIKRRIQKDGCYDAIDLLVLANYTTYMQRTQTAVSLLQEGDYASQVCHSRDCGAFCHNAFKGDNLRLDDHATIHLGGFEGASSNLPVADLAQYLKRYMKKISGDAEGVKAMLFAYCQTMPLSKNEFLLLRAMVAYPEKFLRLTNEYYNKRRACVSPAMQERLRNAVLEETSSFLLLQYLENITL